MKCHCERLAHRSVSRRLGARQSPVGNVLDYQAVPLVTKCSGSHGSINGLQLTENGKFAGVSINDILWVHSGGKNINYYTIRGTDSNNYVQVDALYAFDHNDLSGAVYWKVTSAASTVDNYTYFKNAIDAANTEGGGVVYVPPGYYFFNNSDSLTVKEKVILRGKGSVRKVGWGSPFL